MALHSIISSLLAVSLFLCIVQPASTVSSRVPDSYDPSLNLKVTNFSSIGTNFKSCTNASFVFGSSSAFFDEVIKNSRIGPMKCKNIDMWKRFIIPNQYLGSMRIAYEQYTFTVKEPFELCKSIQTWEERLQTTCVDLLFNSLENDLSSKIQFITQNQTTIYDWINYCNYCKKDVQFSKLDYWNIRDEYAREIIEYFPNQISYCGFAEAGIPLVVGMNQITPKENGYSFICYCQASNYYAFKCFGNLGSGIYSIVLQVLFFSIFSISLIITSFTTLFPRLKIAIIQKQFYNILVPLFVCVSEICGILTQIFLTIGSDLAVSICSNLNIIFLSIALVSWEMHWIRLIYYIMKKKRLFSLISYLVPVTLVILTISALLICVFIVTPDGSASYSLETAGYLSYLQLTLGCLITVTFTVFTIVIYFLLKKVSEVSLMDSKFLKFSVIAAAALFLDSLGIISISATQSYITTVGITFTLLHALFISGISLGLTYVEFDKKEFFELYSCCKCWNDTSDQSRKEPLLSSSGDYSSMEDANNSTTSVQNN